MMLADEFDLWVVEDCAQAHLATYKGQVGTFGDAATFSFYPGKNLGAMGDAGAIITNNLKLAEQMAKFARHGGLVKGIHEIEGINSRLDMQAAILNVKLNHIERWTAQRQKAANKYLARLEGVNHTKVPIINLKRPMSGIYLLLSMRIRWTNEVPKRIKCSDSNYVPYCLTISKSI